MDKLNPILKQWFWILFGVVVIIAAVGWFVGTGALAEKITKRTSAIESLNVTNGKTTPNDQWTAKLTKVRAERQQLLEVASDTLWEQQEEKYMVWPEPMRQYVEGELFGAELSVSALNTYREIYDAQVFELQEIVDAWRRNPRTRDLIPGKMIFNIGALEGIQESKTRWPSGSPKSKAVWYLQEDLWLYTELLQAVAELNMTAGADATISQVPVRKIVSIVLKGGDPSMLAGAGGAAGATAAGAPGAEMMYGGAPGGMMSGEMMAPGSAMGSGEGGYGGMGMGGGAGMPDVDFELAEEIGPATPVTPEGSGTTGAATGGGLYAGAPGGAPGAMMGEMAAGLMAQGDPLLTMRRYVDKGKDLPYKTRAFKMTVIMDHRKIPELLVELTDCAFPVTIVRVNWAMANPNPTYDMNTKMPSSTGAMSSGGMGFPGGAGGEGYMGGGGMGGGGFSESAVTAGGAGGMGAYGMGGMGPGGFGGESGYGGYPSGGMAPGGGFPGSGMAPGGGYPGSGMAPGGGYPGAGMGPGAGYPGMGGAGLNPMQGMFPGGAPGVGGMYEGGGPMGGRMGGASLAMQGPTGRAEIAPALAEPFLAKVVIGGVMTIYRNPALVGLEIASGGTAGATGTLPGGAAAGGATGEGMAPAAGASGAMGATGGTGASAAGTGNAAAAGPMGQAPGAVAPGAGKAPAGSSADGATPGPGTPDPAGASAETASDAASGAATPAAGGTTNGHSAGAAPPAADTGTGGVAPGDESGAPSAASGATGA